MPELPPDLSLRELSADDAAAVAELIGVCDRTFFDIAPPGWRPPSQYQEMSKWEKRLSEEPLWSLAAFDRDGTLVAFVTMRQARGEDQPDQLLPGVGHLGALFVHPDRWRQGIATYLLEQAELAMVERGFPRARLWTAERAPARHFYQRHGWVATEESRFREDFGMTVVGYEKRLVDPDP